MATKVSIANLALSLLGANRITTLEEDSENARRISAVYDDSLADLLRLHPWNFAIRRATLGQLSTTPEFEYTYEFQLPSDCIRVIHVTDGTNTVSDYKIEGRKLLTDDDAIKIKYISHITDPSQYDSQFIMVFAARLAMEVAYPITNQSGVTQTISNLYTERLEVAKQTDGQESSSIQEEDKDNWTIDVRS